MLSNHPVMAFLATAAPARAKAFYADVLGLRLVSDEPHALVFDAAGTMLRIQKAGAVTPAPYTALGWQVPDIAAAVTALAARKVEMVRYPHFDQDARGIWTTPDGTQVAWFRDPDGNLLSLTEFARG